MKFILKISTLLCGFVLFNHFPSHAKSYVVKIVKVNVITGDEDEIRSTVSKFFSALLKNDFKEARKYAVKDKDADNFFVMMENVSKMPGSTKGPIPTIKGVKIDGLKAVVSFVGQPDMKLEKEDGAWKIDVRMKKPPTPKD